ncbi:MAG: 6-phospho-beta-glucosidase [Actinomycetales bacterium]
MRLAVMGGGGFRVPLVYRALSTGPYAGLIDTVALFDTDPGRLAAIRAVLAAMPGCESPPAVESFTDPEPAMEGADVVFAAIREGSTAGRILDERVALDLGVLGQETTGAGGISYALRSIPRMLELARILARVSPDAWLINFTNPAGMVTEALQGVLGGRAIGICDSPIGLVRRAARAAGFALADGSLSGVDYLGLNHLGWLRGLHDDDGDHLPGLLADAGRLAGFEEGRLFGPELPKLLGCLPNEYLFYYYSRREALAGIRSGAATRGESIHAQQQDLYPRLASAGAGAYRLWDAARRSREEGYLAEARGRGEDRDEADLAGGGYEQVALAAMSALLRDEPTELILNVPNAGTVAALPGRAVIEVPCRIDGTGARPLPRPAPTLHQLGLMSALKAVEAAVVDAAVNGSRDSALRAFTLHPLVDSAAVAGALLSGYEHAFPALPLLWRTQLGRR